MPCKECGSYAINHNDYGRDGSDGDLCDVCYWRKRAGNWNAVVESVAQHLETSSDRHRRDYFAAKVRELKTQAPTTEHSSELPPIERCVMRLWRKR